MQGLPPGFRFEPTDEELIAQYLMRKVRGETLPQSWNHIVECDLYDKKSPWDIFQDRHYVLTVLKKTSEKGGKRYSRVAGEGTWHGNTARIPIYDQFKNKIGVKKQFTFKTKNKNHGEWIMHEYSLNDQELIVLCEIIKKKKKKKSGSRNYGLMADHGGDNNRFLLEYDGGMVANSVPEGGNNGMVDAQDYAAYFAEIENYCFNFDDFLLETNYEDGENGSKNSEKECPATPTLPPRGSL